MTRSKQRTHCTHSCRMCDPGKHSPGTPKPSDRRRMQDEKIDPFEEWKSRLVIRTEILGGEPVFPGSRLAVRHIGGLAARGESLGDILEDYPYLTDTDVEFAKIYLEDLAGRDFVQRLRAAAARLTPVTPEAAKLFASGPEISGGIDVEPEDA